MRLAADDFAANGVCVVGAAVPAAALPALQALPAFQSGGRPGSRAFLPTPEVARLVGTGGVLANVATELMGAPMRAVRILCFDKTPETNWAVPWHQDRTIAVASRVEMPGFTAWNLKAGVQHVEPPESILAGMVALRLGLDDCGPENGPLLAVSGSWQLGRVPAGQIKRHVEPGRVQALCANAGDVVAMRGLTVHASERAAQPGHRRVLHVDFSAAELPGGLQWAMPPSRR